MKITDWNSQNDFEKRVLLQRPVVHNAELDSGVANIVNQVKTKGDVALLELTEKFDRVKLKDITVSESEFALAQQIVSPDIKASMQIAIDRISHYQTACLPKAMIIDTADGIVCQKIPRAIERVGLYVPGGQAPLVSTVMMLAIPAKIAECQTRILCTPPNLHGQINPAILVCAKLCGINTIYKVGGAQAVAAMAYGTETILKVDKIFGPGNAWVTAAKLLVSNDPLGASIDCPAGPSELLIIADQTANAEFIAADLLSQAEHGVDSQVILITTSSVLAESVIQCLTQQLAFLPRQTVAQQSLQNGSMIIVETLNEAINISNQYAPEHLILNIENPQAYVAQVQNAGAIFLGQWTPETMGDYITGSNHVLPTYGYANRYSGLSVSDFMKIISVQQVSKKGLKLLGDAAMQLATMENLMAHKNAVQVRLDNIHEFIYEETTQMIAPTILKDFKPYSSARMEASAGSIWLNANESPWDDGLNRYPEPQPLLLKDKLAAYYQVNPDTLLITRGSDEGIDLLMRLYCQPEQDAIVICPPTFGMYEVAAKLQRANIIKIPLLQNNFDCDVKKLLELNPSNIKLLFLCSPNNPTGNVIDRNQVFSLCEKFKNRALVVIDEAYIEFADSESFTHAIERYENLVILRTLSKAFGLAAARIGVLMANAQIIKWLKQIMAPYPLSSLSVDVAMNAFTPQSLVRLEERIAMIKFQREILYKALNQMDIVEQVWHSQANFLLAKFRCSVEQECLRAGIVLRNMESRVGLSNAMRISVGTPEQNQALITKLTRLATVHWE